MDFITDQWNVLLYVGAVRQIGENGVHVLDIGDGDCQVGQPGQRPSFVLVLAEGTRNKHSRCTNLDPAWQRAAAAVYELTVAFTVSWYAVVVS